MQLTRPIYGVLLDHGLRTTKTVWPLRPLGTPITGGGSLEDRDYLSWVRELEGSGVEIGLHGVADESSTRLRIEQGLQCYEDKLGAAPRLHVNHVGQDEAVYWGASRLDPPISWAYRTYRKSRGCCEDTEGHRSGSRYFWGDLLSARARFVRNFVWHDINTTKADPYFPYHDPARPYVPFWFSSTYGSGEHNFVRLLSQPNLDRLAAEGGACVIYTHLGTFENRPEFRAAIRRVAAMNGWFVPASELLTYIGKQRGWLNVSHHRAGFAALQLRWMLQQTPARTLYDRLPGRVLSSSHDSTPAPYPSS